jgi:DNA-binding transcriptional LysR family regulator
MILNINQLRSFYTAAKSKSITLAAEELMVTPPAISMQIKQLEEILGIRLLFREGNSIRLTEVGQVIQKKSASIFRQINDMENYLEDISRAKTGVLKIGCPQTPAKYLLPFLIAEFKKTYPGIKIVLDQGTSNRMIRSLYNHNNELAVIRCRNDDRRLKTKTFGSEEVVLVTALGSRNFPNKEISVAQLSKVPLILQKEGSATRDVVNEYLRRFKIPPLIALESESVDLIKELISQDNGTAFLVKSSVNTELENKKLQAIKILEGSPTIEYGISYLKRKTLSPSAWAFLRIVDKIGDQSSFILNNAPNRDGQSIR